MSDPLTLATIALKTANNVGQANSARAQGNAEAAVAERQAESARLEATRHAGDLRRRNAAILARQRVRYAKGGILLSGSPLDLLADAAAESELAAQEALYDGAKAADGHRLRANTARWRGQAARRQGLLDTGISLLGKLSAKR